MKDVLEVKGFFSLWIDNFLVMDTKNTIGNGLYRLLMEHIELGDSAQRLRLSNLFSDYEMLWSSADGIQSYGGDGIIVQVEEGGTQKIYSLSTSEIAPQTSNGFRWKARGRTGDTLTVLSAYLGKFFNYNKTNNFDYNYAYIDSSHPDLTKSYSSGREIVIEWELTY